jgi:hypothetical protein
MKHIPCYLIFAKNLKKPCAHNDFVVHFKRRLNSKLMNHWQYILERARNFPISEENILFPSYLITKGCLEKIYVSAFGEKFIWSKQQMDLEVQNSS